MVQVINTLPSAGSLFASGVGQGLQAIAERKIGQMEQRNRAQQAAQLSESIGIHPVMANYLAHQPVEVQTAAFQNMDALRAWRPPEQQQQQVPQQQRQPVAPAQAQNLDPRLASKLSPEQTAQLLQRAVQGKQIPEQYAAQIAAQQQQQQGQPVQAQQQMQPQQQVAQVSPQATVNAPAASLNDIFLKPGEKREREKLELRKEEVEGKTNKGAREWLEQYEKPAEASKKNIRDYELLKKIAQKGDIRAGNSAQILNALGLEKFNRNTSTQIADKLIARLGQNAGSAFGTGTRLTNFLEQTYQRSNPSLFNTPEAIVALSDLNILADQINIEKEKNAAQYVREQKGKIGYDANQVVQERSNAKIQKLEDQMLEKTMATFNKFGQGQVNVLQKFKEKPNAAMFPGKEIRSKDGSIFKSINNEWIKQ